MSTLFKRLFRQSLAQIVADGHRTRERSSHPDVGLYIRNLVCWNYKEHDGAFYVIVTQGQELHHYKYKEGPFITEIEAEAHLLQQIRETLATTPSARFFRQRRKLDYDGAGNSHEILRYENGSWAYDRDY